ncbi:MAG: 4-hydroxy-tetrahydrodipicolinate synthase [Clostridia bacterium]|nr:4-hydroxy-tetrahydrodipicolinate synthase [Clostridia bacterium]
MKKVIFKGCGTAIATPFDENGVNYKVFKDMIEHQIKEGVDSIIVCGTTGEASTMTEAERKETIKFVVDIVNKRIPVIAGTGSNNTQAAIEMTKYAESVGADGALVVTPYYNKTTQKGLIEHYKIIASNTLLPIIMYSVPSRTGVNILPETCLELSKIDNIVAIKEASGNISQVAKIASLCGDNLSIYSGNDDQIIPVLSVGGIGVISVLSNIEPKFTHQMVYDYFNGNIEEAKRKQLSSLNLIENLFSEVNPIPVKAGLNIIGYNYGIPRLPLIEMSEDKKSNLKKAIEEFGK